MSEETIFRVQATIGLDLSVTTRKGRTRHWVMEMLKKTLETSPLAFLGQMTLENVVINECEVVPPPKRKAK